MNAPLAESHMEFRRNLVEFPSRTDGNDNSKRDRIYAGWGSCRSCSCRGYTKSGDGSTCGTCRHHYDQHR